MDRLNQLKGEAAGGSGDSTVDTTSPPSDAYMSANESSKYFSLSDSTFDITPIKDVSLASTSADSDHTVTGPDELISNLSPMGTNDKSNSYKIGQQIEAANILSGGVDIFDDNDNSFDGDELVIDDNIELDDNANDDNIELDDNANGDNIELDDNANDEAVPIIEEIAEPEPPVVEAEVEAEPNVASREMEVILQIDGNNVNAIDIGNGLYLYRKDGQDELAAIQIVNDDPDHSFKFLKVRDNAEGNLEVYEEIEIEVPKEVPTNEKEVDKNVHVPIHVNKVMSGTTSYKIAEKIDKSPEMEPVASTSKANEDKKTSPEPKSETHRNGKMVKFSESRKSPLGCFTPMTFHSTPIKEGKPLTKTMVDLQLHPNRHSDNVKKTIEVHTDSVKQKAVEPLLKEKDITESVNNNSTEKADNADLTKKDLPKSNIADQPKPEENKVEKLIIEKNDNLSSNAKTSNSTDTYGIKSDVEKDSLLDKVGFENQPSNIQLSQGVQEPSKSETKSNKVKDIATKTLFTNENPQKEKFVHQLQSSQGVQQPPKSGTKSNKVKDIATEGLFSNENRQKEKLVDQQPSNIQSSQGIQEPPKSETKSNKVKDIATKALFTKENPQKQKFVDQSSTKTDQEATVITKSENIVVISKPVNSILPLLSETTNNVTNSILLEKIIENDKNITVKDKTELEENKQKVQPKKDNCTFTNETVDNTTTNAGPHSILPDKTLEAEVESIIQNKDSNLSTKLLEAEVECFIQNKDSKNDSETITNVSSPSIHQEPEKLNIGNVETCAVNTINAFERVPELPPTGTVEPKEVKENKETNNTSVISKISNVIKTKNDNQKETILSHARKESKGENQLATITCTQVLKDVEGVKCHKIDNIVKKIEEPKSNPEMKLQEKSYHKSMNSTKLSQTTTSTIVGEIKPLVKEAQPEIKSLEMEKQTLQMPKLKPLEQVVVAFSAPDRKAIQKPVLSITEPAIKSSEKDVKSAENIRALQNSSQIVVIDNAKTTESGLKSNCVSDVKPLLKTVHLIPVPKVRPSEKATTSTALPVERAAEYNLNVINKTAKPVPHIPVAADIANKQKHIPVKTLKSEELKEHITLSKEALSNLQNKNFTQNKIESRDIRKPVKKPIQEPIPVNNNHTVAVPFGKWTDVNRQEFLNKFKEVKAPVNSSSNQIKNSNDLNRRDVLKKIDSQRAQTIINNTAKAQEKLNVKSETVFSNKVVPLKVESRIPIKNENVDVKPKLLASKNTTKTDNLQKGAVTTTVPTTSTKAESDATTAKTESTTRVDLSTATMASLIDKTIEDMINRVVPCKNAAEEPKESTNIASEPDSVVQIPIVPEVPKVKEADAPVTLDDIEMKMNELHGIPFVERPPHELPKVLKPEIKTFNKVEKPQGKITVIPKIISSPSEAQVAKDSIFGVDSDEEVIGHEPVTGDIDNKKKTISDKKITIQEKKSSRSEKSTDSLRSKDALSKEVIITETEFDKFARRNSITYENCLTVNFEHKEPHNVVQTVKPKDAPKVNPKNETVRIEAKSKVPQKLPIGQNMGEKDVGASKLSSVTGDSSNKNYQSKIHSAYQSLTAKHQAARAITIIEDKPVKVVFVESNTTFIPINISATNNTESVDSDMLEVIDENKHQEKTKIKHQRKQVLTPVEAPELELIQPSDIGLDMSPKKKRKIDDNKTDKHVKNLMHKKSYLLGRNTATEEKTAKIQVLPNEPPIEIINENAIERQDTASAIDSLVKAAELLETQEENNINSKSITESLNSSTNTPLKRGRGRPRKYPLPDGATDIKTSPQKKPRLIDAKPAKPGSISDDYDDDTSEEEMIRENWTMGKINENIVCPICNKLFRSENVVFKHVKHCTGVSPNRSESDKQSPHRERLSQDSESISDVDCETPVREIRNSPPKKRKSKESTKSDTKPDISKSEDIKDDATDVRDSPIKEKPEKHEKDKIDEPHKVAIPRINQHASNLVCEFCGKMFRQLSYLVSHKLQHNKDHTKKTGKEAQNSNKLQVFSCEVCKKEFRKLHHLVQHRIIHKPDSVPKRTLRNSSEQSEIKNVNEEAAAKQNDDPSAGFRCEPCDKSFRKLHHLVEHRETHDGINRQRPTTSQLTVQKPLPQPQCEICNKTFRKLHHLVEHKEQHADTSSDKSDDKSVKSSLSTKDIIHECSLCYMVFPNEHSLTKHSVICSRKKRQSKQLKENSEKESMVDDDKNKKSEENIDGEDVIIVTKIDTDETIDNEVKCIKDQDHEIVKKSIEVEEKEEVKESLIKEMKQINHNTINHNEVAKEYLDQAKESKLVDNKSTESLTEPSKQDGAKLDGDVVKEPSVGPDKIKKIDHKEVKLIRDTPKKKAPAKDNVTPTVTKRQKTIDRPFLAVEVTKVSVESSDDDEVRYMFNPNFKLDVNTEGNKFMKIVASKRNSLQFESTNTKNLVSRRASLQQHPKILRIKPEAVERKLKVGEPTAPSKHIPSTSEAEVHIDSDDSDVKYSFPKSAPQALNPAEVRKQKERAKPRKSLIEKRKSLGGIAKRKSLGKGITAKLKDSPVKTIKKRTLGAEHRCDCGQLFSSAALLSRHTSLAHTPPRIRRCRDPPPDPPKPLPAKQHPAKPLPAKQLPAKLLPVKQLPAKPPTKSKQMEKSKPATRKSSVKSDLSDSNSKPSVSTRKSSNRTEATTLTETRKSIKPKSDPKVESKTVAVKTRRSIAHAGVPVPEKMRKLMEKSINERALD